MRATGACGRCGRGDARRRRSRSSSRRGARFWGAPLGRQSCSWGEARGRRAPARARASAGHVRTRRRPVAPAARGDAARGAAPFSPQEELRGPSWRHAGRRAGCARAARAGRSKVVAVEGCSDGEERGRARRARCASWWLRDVRGRAPGGPGRGGRAKRAAGRRAGVGRGARGARRERRGGRGRSGGPVAARRASARVFSRRGGSG